MCQGPEELAFSPLEPNSHLEPQLGPGARGVVPVLQKKGIGEKDWGDGGERKKRSKVTNSPPPVCLSLSPRVSLCLWLSPQLPRARFSSLFHPFLRQPPSWTPPAPTPASTPPAARGGGSRLEAPSPDSERLTKSSSRGPLGSGSPSRARRSSRGHFRARGAAKVRGGAMGRGRLMET